MKNTSSVQYTVQKQPLLKGQTLRTKGKNGRAIYPFWDLKPGHSFKFPSAKRVAVRGSLTKHNLTRKRNGKKTITCRVIRINKTEHACICTGWNGKESKSAMTYLTGGSK
tara:strand:- start:202 stop:531 length:330 start_codon:yes stop_codon:yes gene_type:complete